MLKDFSPRRLIKTVQFLLKPDTYLGAKEKLQLNTEAVPYSNPIYAQGDEVLLFEILKSLTLGQSFSFRPGKKKARAKPVP